MHLAFRKLLMLALFMSMATCIYEHQSGVNDWHIKTYGELDEIMITNKQIYYLGSDGSWGKISKTTGSVDYSHDKDNNHIIQWEKEMNKDQKSELVIFDKSSSFIYNFGRNNFLELNEVNFDKDPIAHSFISKDKILVLSENQAYVVTKTVQKDAVTASVNETFIALFKKEISTDVNFYILSWSEKSGDLCFLQVSQKNLLNNTEYTSSQLEKQCLTLDADFQQQYLQVASDFVFYDNEVTKFAFSLNSFKFLNNSIIPQYDSYEVLFYENLMIASVEDSYQVYKFSDDSFSKISIANSLSKTSKYYKFFSHDSSEDDDQDVFYYISSSSSEVELVKATIASESQTLSIAKWSGSYASDKYNQIKKIWIRLASENTPEILIQDTTLRTYFYNNGEIEWTREESLAYIDKIMFLDYSEIVSEHVNSYYQLLDDHGRYNPLYLIHCFKERLQQEGTAMYNGLINSYDGIIDFGKKLLNVKTIKDLIALNKEGDNSDYEIKYGLIKILIVSTEQNNLIGMETKNGNILWKVSLTDKFNLDTSKTLKNLGMFNIIQKEGDLVKEYSLFLIEYDNQVLVYEIQPLTGIIDLHSTLNIKGVKNVLEIKIGSNDVLAIIDENFEVHGFPNYNSDPITQDSAHKYIFYLYNQENNSINGYMYYSSKFINIWSMTFSENEKIIQIDDSFNPADGAPNIALYDDSKVILKHIDYSNFAVITKSRGPSKNMANLHENGVLNLYIINAKTGRVLFNHFQQNVELDLPVNLAFDENSVFVTYFNPVQSLYEIWVVESYQQVIETSFARMLERYYVQGKPEYQENLNYIQEDPSLLFLEQKYGFPFGIKSFQISRTKLSLTKRNLVIITPNNQIYSLDRTVLSTRRALKDLTTNTPINTGFSFESTDLPAYFYLLPVNFLNYLTYNLNLKNLDNIQFSPTNLESTALFISYGGDLFFGKISPEKNYDIISEDFNYIFLVISVISVIILTYVMRQLARNAKVYKIFYKI